MPHDLVERIVRAVHRHARSEAAKDIDTGVDAAVVVSIGKEAEREPDVGQPRWKAHVRGHHAHNRVRLAIQHD